MIASILSKNCVEWFTNKTSLENASIKEAFRKGILWHEILFYQNFVNLRVHVATCSFWLFFFYCWQYHRQMAPSPPFTHIHPVPFFPFLCPSPLLSVSAGYSCMFCFFFPRKFWSHWEIQAAPWTEHWMTWHNVRITEHTAKESTDKQTTEHTAKQTQRIRVCMHAC